MPGSIGSLTKSKKCKRHGEYQAFVLGKNPVTGKDRTTNCPRCVEEYEAKRSAEESGQKALLVQENTSRSGIPKRFSMSSLSNFKAKWDESRKILGVVRAYSSRLIECMGQGTSLVLCGNIGTGKTHLACGVANHALSLGLSVRYTTAYSAVSEVKETYRGNGKTERQVLNEFKKCDLLVLDEVGVQFGSDAEHLILYQIINGRYEDMRPMILVSNLNEKGLADYIGDRCVDRLREGGGAVLPFTWTSYRK